MKNILTLIFITAGQLLFSQTDTYWLLDGGSAVMDEGLDISTDAAGNTYTTGYFSGTAQFGSGISLASTGTTDIFVAKVNAQGVYQWAVKAGGSGPDKGIGIKSDAQGNTYVTGFYQGSATFGAVTITSSGNSQDIFLAKYNNQGVLQWVKSAGGPLGDGGNAVNIDNAGNVYLTGQFSGTANFGSNTLTSMTDPNTGAPSFDVFTAKYNAANGSEIWAVKGSAKYTDRGLDIACDASGNVYVTGQFSDTVTFGVQHNNNMYNAIFLIKYNSSGAEQWFRYMGGSTQCISYGLAVDNNSDIYVTGDFINQLMFFGTTNFNLTNTYPNCIFVSKYSAAGDLLWAKSDGSNSEVTSRNIALDDASNAYITGSFKCRFNEYSDFYGQGIFNSVGYWDVFATKYDAAGNRIWAKQSGGREDDRGYGIAVDANHDITVCGGYYDKIYFPGSANFIWPNASYFHTHNCYYYYYSYCNDNFYDRFYYLSASGVSDIFICKGFDPARAPYDYYYRPNSTLCSAPYEGVYISDYQGQSIDTVISCKNEYVFTSPQTGAAGPAYTYLWSNNTVNSYMLISNTGYYDVIQTSDDGCFVSHDSVYAIINSPPSKPTITDTKGININALVTNPIKLCMPDSVILTAGNICSSCTGLWSGVGNVISQLSIQPTQTGTFTFHVEDTVTHCIDTNSVWVELDSNLIMPPITSFLTGPDTVSICLGDSFAVHIKDIIPYNPYPPYFWHHSTVWGFNPPVVNDTNVHTAGCYPSQTGLYTIYEKHTIILENACDTFIVIFYDTIAVYAVVHPVPVISISLSGDTTICPGDTAVIHINTNGDQYNWTGNGIIGPHNSDSVMINMLGNYEVSVILTDNNGCSSSRNYFFSIINKPSPVITMNPANGLICPGEIVTLTCNQTGSYSWYGPGGSIIGSQQTIDVNTSGMYYCVLTDNYGCILVSNTVEVIQYNTPYLIASPSTVLCQGDTIILSAITNDGSTLQWMPPLSGNGLSQTISAPGTYTCNITSCGILTPVSIIITQSTLNANIAASGPLDFCPGDSVILSGSGGGSVYNWSNDSMTQSIVVYNSGIFSVTISDSYGCSVVTDSLIVSVYDIDPPSSHDTTVCYGASVTIHADAAGPIDWFSSPSGGAAVFTGNDFTTPVITANITYYLQTSDSVCNSFKTPVHINILPGSYPHTISGDSAVCEGETINIYIDSATAGTYSWTGPDGFHSDLPDVEIINASVLNSGTYTLVVSPNGCAAQTVSFDIEVSAYPQAKFDYTLEPVCEGIKGEFINFSQASTGFEWYFSNGFTANSQELTYIFNYGDYIDVFLVAYNNSCTDTLMLSDIPLDFSEAVTLPPPNVFTPNSDAMNDCYRLKTSPAFADCYEMEIYNRWGKRMFVKDATNNCWDGKNRKTGKDCDDGVYYYIITIGKKDYHGSVTLLR